MENKPSVLVVSIGYGVIISLAAVVLSLILFLLNIKGGNGLEWLSYLILIGGIWLAQLNYRNKSLAVLSATDKHSRWVCSSAFA